MLLIASGNDYVVVYADHFEIKSDSLLKMSRGSKLHSYMEVETVSGQPQPGVSEAIGYALLQLFAKAGRSNTRELYVKLKNGAEKTYLLDIPSHELSKLVSQINGLLVR